MPRSLKKFSRIRSKGNDGIVQRVTDHSEYGGHDRQVERQPEDREEAHGHDDVVHQCRDGAGCKLPLKAEHDVGEDHHQREDHRETALLGQFLSDLRTDTTRRGAYRRSGHSDSSVSWSCVRISSVSPSCGGSRTSTSVSAPNSCTSAHRGNPPLRDRHGWPRDRPPPDTAPSMQDAAREVDTEVQPAGRQRDDRCDD